MVARSNLVVAHVVPGYLPARGGIETLLDGVAPKLLETYGIHTTIVAPRFLNERPKRFVNEGIEVLSVDMPHRYSQEALTVRGARLFAHCRQIVDAVKPDVLHIHGIWYLFAPMTMVGRARGVPTMHHIHGELESTTRRSHKSILASSAKLLAVSESVAQSVRRIADRKLPVEVVPNGIPGIMTSGKPATDLRVALVGRLEGPKGFHQGLLALSALINDFPNLHVAVVGVGEDLIPLQRLTSELGIGDRVSFLGRLSREETLAALNECSVVMIPSLTMEGFSLVAVEAALLGKPVVSYRVGGLSETVSDGVSGTLVNIGDIDGLVRATRDYLSDACLRQKHGCAARERALSLFDVERFAGELAQHYRAFAASTERSRRDLSSEYVSKSL